MDRIGKATTKAKEAVFIDLRSSVTGSKKVFQHSDKRPVWLSTLILRDIEDVWNWGPNGSWLKNGFSLQADLSVCSFCSVLMLLRSCAFDVEEC
jgi:hypothetical protein